MNKFFYYSPLCVGTSAPTAFSFDPYITAIKDLLVSELQQLVYYIEKLKEFDVDMSEYTDKVIDFISVIIVNLDFNRESFFVIMEDLYNNRIILEKLYISACEKIDVNPDILKNNTLDFTKKDNILKALNEREKNIQNDDIKNKISKDKRNLYEIMINLVLNSCNCLIELKTYNIDFKEAKDEVLKLLNTINFPALTEEELIIVIKSFSKCNYQIMKKLNQSIINEYGPVIKNKAKMTLNEGKAILVSGGCFKDLEMILKSTKGLNINVYAHHDTVNAFQYKRFLSYSNLIGYYQKSNNNFPLDFASFPGPIFLSKNSIPKIDVIRGQIYTSAKYPAFGISKIEKDDFSPLIEYALESVGFSENKTMHEFYIGYSETEVLNIVNDVVEKLRLKKLKHIFVVGIVDKFSSETNYIQDFLNIAPNDTFTFTFASVNSSVNSFNVNSFFDFSILYKILETIDDSIDDFSENISVILTDCNNSTISHVFNLIHLGVNSIFLGPCCPSVINPVLLDGLSDLFNIKQISNAKDDIGNVLNKK